MDVIQNRQQKRMIDINRITESLLHSEKFNNNEIKEKELILIIMSETGLAYRTAREYLQVAKYNIKKVKDEQI